jgi:hypothetical protein
MDKHEICIESCYQEAQESGTPASDDLEWTNEQFQQCIDTCS